VKLAEVTGPNRCPGLVLFSSGTGLLLALLIFCRLANTKTGIICVVYGNIAFPCRVLMYYTIAFSICALLQIC